MFAVIKTGGKQYKVAAQDVITIEKLAAEAGARVAFDQVLMLVHEGGTDLGAPHVSGVTVMGEVVEQTRGPKTISFKKRRRKNSKRKRGHRQDLTVVRIMEILTGGARPALAVPDTAPAAMSPAPDRDRSNLSLISGIGPTIEKKLRAAGVMSWDQIAAWTGDDIARLDQELGLRGRIVREEWIEQAKELIEGKPPRAKVDQAELASGKDL